MEKHSELDKNLVGRAYAEASLRHKKPRDAARAARQELHRVAGAYFGTDAGKRAMKLLSAWPDGGDEALSKILSLHSSTRERLPLPETDALYRRIFETAGRPSRVLDVACGLNPIYLAARGIPVNGVDAHLGAVGLINRFAERNGLDARAEGIDILTDPLPEGRFPLALLMKLLPLLGDAGYRLLEAIDAEHVCLSFPTRTLSGRDVGMEQHHGRSFEENCPDKFEILDRFVHRSELIYILKER
ncbi:MAG: 16S rRNA (guanine(1405)-N(7))-methyltransferase RmtF [Clostridiales bacterium]|jgi:16S rRNA (guanine(1405)-N(7))-methyltransferase|nr:16S rRNA (guanine(1405)-N(7))-methyltransferase RmtF [Clostridiales bacterium]